MAQAMPSCFHSVGKDSGAVSPEYVVQGTEEEKEEKAVEHFDETNWEREEKKQWEMVGRVQCNEIAVDNSILDSIWLNSTGLFLFLCPLCYTPCQRGQQQEGLQRLRSLHGYS